MADNMENKASAKGESVESSAPSNKTKENEVDMLKKQNKPFTQPLNCETSAITAAAGEGNGGDGGNEPPSTNKKPEGNNTTQKNQIKTNGSSTQEKTKRKCGDPIDMVTGSFTIEQTEFVTKEIFGEFKITRMYESIYKNYDSILGERWFLSLGTYLHRDEDGINILSPERTIEHFILNEDGNWENARGQDLSLQLKEKDGAYILNSEGEKKQYHYDVEGKLVRIVDQNHNVISIDYKGKLLDTVLFTNGQRLSFEYDGNKLVSMTDIIGRKVSYHYEDELLTTVVYQNGGSIKYTYTKEGYLETITDQNGNKYVRNEYDMNGRVNKQFLRDVNGQEHEYRMIYQDDDRVNTFLNMETGERVEQHYNKNKLPIKTTYTDGSTEEAAYDKRDNKVWEKDRRGFEIHRKFDQNSRIVEETLPNGLTTMYQYDEKGNLIHQWDNTGFDQIIQYDSNGNFIEIREKIDEQHSSCSLYFYDHYGRTINWTDSNGNTISYTYDTMFPMPSTVTTAEGITFHYHHDKVGHCMEISGKKGSIRYAYNSMVYKTMITNPLGEVTRYSYDLHSNLTKVVRSNHADNDRSEIGVRYEYDTFDQLITEIDELGNVMAKHRDMNGNVIKEIHPNAYDPFTRDGIGTCYQYDVENHQIKAIYPDGGIMRTKYDVEGNMIKRIQPEQYDPKIDDGLGYCYEYDAMNQLTQITNPEGVVEYRYLYDLKGNVLKEIDALGYLSANEDMERIGILYKYNFLGWLTEKRTPIQIKDGIVEYQLSRYQYDLVGNLIKECQYLEYQNETEARGAAHLISFVYDKDYRQIQVSDSTGAEVNYRYNSRNSCVEETIKQSEDVKQILCYEYDQAERLVSTSYVIQEVDNQTFAKTRYQYDKTGNITRILLPEGGEIRRTYDIADRMICEEHIEKKSGIQNKTNLQYDKAGNLVEVVDSLGRSKQFSYDLRDRKVSQTNRDGGVIKYYYNKNNQLTKIIYPNQYQSDGESGTGYQYTYDMLGRILTVISPDGHVVETNVYDQKGHVIKQLKGIQAGVEYDYNLVGYPVRIGTMGGASQEFIYDAQLNIIGVVDGNKNRTNCHVDVWGRITKIEKPDNSTEQYTYDFAGNMTSSTDGEGHTIKYVYNQGGDLSAIIDANGDIEEYFYDYEHRIKQNIDRNGTIIEYDYNLYGAPLYRRTQDHEYEDYYEYTKEGLLKSATSKRMKYSYEYDKMNRLTRKSASGRTLLEMKYDLNGNQIQQVDLTGKMTEYQYNQLDLLEQVIDNGNPISTYKYNPDGTIHSQQHGTLYKQYGYDKDQNLTELNIRSGEQVIVENRYKYDSATRF